MDGQTRQGAQSNRFKARKRIEAVLIAVADVDEVVAVHFRNYFLVDLTGCEEEAVGRLVDVEVPRSISSCETDETVSDKSGFVVYLTADIGWQVQDGSSVPSEVTHQCFTVICKQFRWACEMSELNLCSVSRLLPDFPLERRPTS